MKELFNNIEWMSTLAVLTSVAGALFSAFILRRKMNADKKLSEQLKNDTNFVSKYKEQLDKIIRLQEESKKKLSDETDLLSELDLKTLEIKTESLKLELQRQKLEIIRNYLEVLTKNLDSKKDMNEIIEALNQKSIKGQANYINQILHQSGSTEQIYFEEN